MKMRNILLFATLVLVGCSNEEHPLFEEGMIMIEGTVAVEDEVTGETILFGGAVDDVSLPTDILNFETAGRSGLFRIRNFFDVDTSGMYVSMVYEDRGLSRYFWSGQIAESLEDLNNGVFLYVFRLDARNGQVNDLIRVDKTPTANDGFAELDESEVDHYLSIARNYLRQAILSEIVSIDLVDNKDLPDNYLFFVANMPIGNWKVEIVIERETERLISIETPTILTFD